MVRAERCAAILALGLVAGACGPAAPPGPFTIVLLGDSEEYAMSDPQTYMAQTGWIAERRERDNVRFVIHLGDMTKRNTPEEWAVADAAFEVLERAGIPFTVLPGNHDHPVERGLRDTTRFNEWFGPRRFADHSQYGGHFGAGNENNFWRFHAGGTELLVLALEFAPGKDALCWADDVIRRHPERHVLIATHCYLDVGGDYHDGCASGYDVVGSDGRTLWRELVTRHSNVFAVVGGHAGGADVSTRTTDAGQPVHQILSDYFPEPWFGQPHGRGWLRALRFLPRAGAIEVRPQSIRDDVRRFTQDRYPGDPTAFPHTAKLEFPPRGAGTGRHYVYLRRSDRFHDRLVGEDADATATPTVGAAPTGETVVVWASADGAIRARGFDGAGCERLPETTLAAEGTSPSVSVLHDGRFVVAWQTRDAQGRGRVRIGSYERDGTRRWEDGVDEDRPAGQARPTVGCAGDGACTVAWEAPGVRMARFEAAVASRIAGAPVEPSGRSRRAAVASNDGSVLAWEGRGRIDVAGHDRDGRLRFGPLVVGSASRTGARRPDVALAPDGGFVVVWESGPIETPGVRVAGFDAAGRRRFGEIDLAPGAYAASPRVAIDERGTVVVVWEGRDEEDDEEDAPEVRLTLLGLDGSRKLGRITVHADGDGPQVAPALAVDARGYRTIVWADDVNADGRFAILARGLDRRDFPVR